MGRRTRACQICRARKSRCLPAANGLGCKRCEDAGTECISHEATKRASQLRSSKGRFAPNDRGIPKSNLEENTPSVLADGAQRLAGSPSLIEPTRLAGATDHTADPFGQTLFDTLAIGGGDQWPTCKSLHDQEANAFVDRYRHMSQTVPFAIQLFPESSPVSSVATTVLADDGVQKLDWIDNKVGAATATLGRLLHDSPILLLAVILTGSSSNPEFERQADDLFRHILAHRVVVKGQKSVELLQSLLTYLTWYHHRFDPETLQFYQFLQLANGMIFDLGFPKKFAKDKELTPRTTCDSNELRTFLLCYYLNCGGAVLGYDRPENMQCIGSLRNAANILADLSPLQHDKEAPSWVELLHSVARHHNVSQLVTCKSSPVASGSTLLGDWETGHLHAGSSQPLISSFHFTKAYTLLKSSKGNPPSTEDIQVCLNHFHTLLSKILGQGSGYILRMGTIEWAHLITTLFLLARLGQFAGSNRFKVDSALRSPVHEYTARFRALRSDLRTRAVTDITLGAPHLLSWLDRILDAVVARAVSWEGPSTQSASEIGHRESAYELVNSFLGEGRSTSTRARLAIIPIRDEAQHVPVEDFWSHFMSDWLNW